MTPYAASLGGLPRSTVGERYQVDAPHADKAPAAVRAFAERSMAEP